MANKWMLIPPGGPSGPFWGVMAQSGMIVALQMGNKEFAEFTVKAGNAAQCDHETITEAAARLREIMKRDFPDNAPEEWPIEQGTFDYVLRSVMEAVFGPVVGYR